MDSHAGVFLAIFIASLIIISGAFDDKPKPENYIKELKLLAKKENLDVEYFNIYLKDRELEVERSDDLYSLNNLSLMNEFIAQFNREISIYNPDFVD